MITPGNIVLAEFQQNDGKYKRRPALLIKLVPPFEDYLLCAISSQVRYYQEETDIRLSDKDSDFTSTGLKSSSIIRGGYLATVSPEYIPGTIGSISKEKYESLIQKLGAFINEQ